MLRTLGRADAKLAPASARSRYGDCHVGDVHKAALTPITFMGCAGHFMAYAVDADVPALLGKEALGTLGAHLDFCQRVRTLETLCADMGAVGRYILTVAVFPG